MPFNDSPRLEKPAAEPDRVLREETGPSSEAEEIETPIEAEAQAKAEHEFENERKIPTTCRKAIVSVNGKDVDEVSLPAHERAA